MEYHCAETACNNVACYGFGENTHCYTHRGDNMWLTFDEEDDYKIAIFDITKKKNNLCIFKQCSKRPSYNFPGRKTRFCTTHKLSGMINVSRKMCIVCEIKQANFNYFNRPASYCATCKLEGMVNVVSKRCKCGRAVANFALPGLKAEYCAECKSPEMVDVKNKRCKCGKHVARFALPGQRAEYCDSCKSDGMINVNSPKCVCGKAQPRYGYFGKSPRHCSVCREDDMVNLADKRCNCGKHHANFGLPNNTPTHCSECRSIDMINLSHPKCKSEWCDTLQSKSPALRGYCSFCYHNLFPEEPRIRNFKIKEAHFVEYVFVKYPDYEWIYDCKISGGCSDKRPDLLLDLLTHVIIIEIDEYGHVGYNQSHEIQRMKLISGDLADRPIIYLRLNPDNYVYNKEIIPGCFKQHEKTGLLIPAKNGELHKRLSRLGDRIKHHVTHIPHKTEIEYLFYNS